MKTAQLSPLLKKAALIGVLGAVVIGGAAAAVNPTPAQGQTTNEDENRITMTAVPQRLGDDNSLRIAPGETEQVQVQIRNSSNEEISVVSRVTDYIIGEDGFTPTPVRENVSNRWSLASWLTLAPSSQTLSPNETGAVNVLIEVPEDALPGGHYAMVTHEPANGAINEDGTINEAALESASAVSQKVGTLLYVTVEGPINEEAFIRDFNFPKLTEFGPVPFSFTVENASDIHIKPRTTVEIFNMLGNKIDTIEIEPQNVFPLMSRDFEGRWDKVWGTGLYTARLTMSYGETGAVTVAQTQFWLLPIKLILAGIIALLTLIAIFISVRRHYIHRQGHEQKRIQMLEKRLQELEGNNLDKYED